jgi:hypothetical protein
MIQPLFARACTFRNFWVAEHFEHSWRAGRHGRSISPSPAGFVGWRWVANDAAARLPEVHQGIHQIVSEPDEEPQHAPITRALMVRREVDGIHLKVRLDQEKLCLLVMLGVRAGALFRKGKPKPKSPETNFIEVRASAETDIEVRASAETERV